MKRKKGDLPTGRAHTSRNKKYIIYKKIILGRWKQWQDHLMLICMLQVRLKISNSCRCFWRCRKAVPDFRTSVVLMHSSYYLFLV
jgi:hypothetical protein